MQRQRNDEDYYRLIDFMFTNEDALREAIEQIKTARPIPEIRTGSYNSDPTAAEAIRNLEPVGEVIIDSRRIVSPEVWLEVIETTYEYLRYKDEVWARAIKRFYNREHYSKVCSRCNITIDKLYKVIKLSRQKAALIASYKRLIKPF